jgi:hypothetical protein
MKRRYWCASYQIAARRIEDGAEIVYFRSGRFDAAQHLPAQVDHTSGIAIYASNNTGGKSN